MKKALTIIGIMVLVAAIAIPVMAQGPGQGKGRMMQGHGPGDPANCPRYGAWDDKLSDEQRSALQLALGVDAGPAKTIAIHAATPLAATRRLVEARETIDDLPPTPTKAKSQRLARMTLTSGSRASDVRLAAGFEDRVTFNDDGSITMVNPDAQLVMACAAALVGATAAAPPAAPAETQIEAQVEASAEASAETSAEAPAEWKSAESSARLGIRIFRTPFSCSASIRSWSM